METSMVFGVPDEIVTVEVSKSGALIVGVVGVPPPSKETVVGSVNLSLQFFPMNELSLKKNL